MKRIVLGLILLLTAGGIACTSTPNPDQDITGFSFDLTCKGVALSKALPYTPADGGLNQTIVMSDSTIGAQYDEYTPRYTDDMPAEWFPQIIDGTFVYDQVELVACIHRTAVEPVDIACDFEDGYSINVHNATYEMTLRDPQTAVIIDQQTVTNEGTCPTLFALFSDDQKEEDQFADIKDAQIQAFIEPYVK